MDFVIDIIWWVKSLWGGVNIEWIVWANYSKK